MEEELARYENKWVAILESERRIVASGDRAIEAMRAAEAQGYSDTALFKVRSFGNERVHQANIAVTGLGAIDTLVAFRQRLP